MRWIVAWWLVFSALFGYEYNAFLLQTQSSLYPKIIGFDQKLRDHIDDGRIDLCILHEEIDTAVAQDLARTITKRFSTIDALPLRLHSLKFTPFLADKHPKKRCDAVYVLRSSDARLKKVAQMIRHKHIYSFTYDRHDLDHGFLCNVAIEKDVRIYLNKRILQQERFDFVDALFSIARVVE